MKRFLFHEKGHCVRSNKDLYLVGLSNILPGNNKVQPQLRKNSSQTLHSA